MKEELEKIEILMKLNSLELPILRKLLIWVERMKTVKNEKKSNLKSY
jgi:hypothetical protein